MDDHKDAPIRPFGFDSRTALHCGVGSRRCKTAEKLWIKLWKTKFTRPAPCDSSRKPIKG